MTTTPILALDELASGQAIPETTVNESVRWLEFLSAGGKVLDRGLTAEPGSPIDGDAYLLPATPTGTHWSGNGGKIAMYISTAWEFKAAKEGMRLYVADEDVTIVYDGSAWATVGGASLTAAAASDVRTGTSTTTAVTPGALADASAPQTLTDGATTTWDMSAGFNAKWTLGGNRTLAVTNPKAGWPYSLAVIQDGTGSRTVTWPSSFDWGTAGAPTLTTTASKRDRITLFCTDAATPKFDAFLSGKGFS